MLVYFSRIPVQAKASKAQPSHEKNDARPSGAAYQKGNQKGLRFHLRRITLFHFAISCAGGNKFGKNNWSKGHGKSKSYSSGSSWDKKAPSWDKQARSW